MDRSVARDAAPVAAQPLAAWLPRLPLADAWPVIAFVTLSSLSFYRAALVDRTYGSYSGCVGCLNATVMANDGMLLVSLVGLLAVTRLPIHRSVRAFIACLGVLAVCAFSLDILVFRLLSQRLLVSDALHFSGDVMLLATVATPWLDQPHGALFTFVVIVACVATWISLASPPAKDRMRVVGWAMLAGMGFAVDVNTPRIEYIHEIAFENVWQVNREVDPSRPYTEAFWRHHSSLPAQPAECEPGMGAQPSVVVAVVESLSAYQSKLFSGLHDYTPQLDALARRSSYFTGFHANGFSTEGGLIALLTGYVPVPTAGRFGSTMAFTRVSHDFQRELAQRGYATAFFTTGDLDMGKRREWLRDIGIGYAEGAEQAFYRGMPRGPFGAASDRALVDRFLQWQETEGRKRPFMATLLTVGTHPPFISADTGESGEPQAVRRMDRELARLARVLEKRGFFEHGILVIVGDHRAMTPIPRRELEVLGESAVVRVPAIVVGASGLPAGEIRGGFQQTDLIPSLRHVLYSYSCRDPWEGRFLGANPDPPIDIVHADPLRRNELTIVEGADLYHVILDGDETRFAGREPPVDAAAILARINYERMSRMAEFAPERKLLAAQ